ncbi:hypothetical protein [Streptomyces sp. NPDC059009]|uniref:hypothetical protein n=1 Tax=Streptomyces sp. NPDC059009 TaxID=3346694 RepID=UPI0036AEBACC
MAIRVKAAALALAAGAGLALTQSGTAAAAGHWVPGLHQSHDHSRDVDTGMNGVEVHGRIYWSDIYKISIAGVVQDNARDGKGAVAEVGYYYQGSNGWTWTTRTAAKASGGYGSSTQFKARNYTSGLHNGVWMKGVKLRACLETSQARVCGAWR